MFTRSAKHFEELLMLEALSVKCKILFLTGLGLSLGASLYLKCYFFYFWEQNVMLLLIYVKAEICFCGNLNNESLQSITSYIKGAYRVKAVQLFLLSRLDVYRLFSVTDC